MQRLKDGTGAPGTGDTNSCEHHGELSTTHLQQQQVLSYLSILSIFKIKLLFQDLYSTQKSCPDFSTVIINEYVVLSFFRTEIPIFFAECNDVIGL